MIDFCVLALGDDEDAPLAPVADVTMDVITDIISPDILGHVVRESDSMDPPLSFDILSRFISRSDDVLAFSSMDLSVFEYSFVSFIDDIDVCAPHCHIFMILMMSLCIMIWMKVINLTSIISLFMSEFHLLLMRLRQLTSVQRTILES